MDANGLSRGEFNILAYFSVCLKVLLLPNSLPISKGKRAKITGGFKDKEEVITYLIAQLGKNERFDRNIINGADIIKSAINIIFSARELIGGRICLVECEGCKELIKYYTDNGFSLLPLDEEGNSESEENPKHQLIRYIA